MNFRDFVSQKAEFEKRVRESIENDLAGYGLQVLTISVKEHSDFKEYDPEDGLDALAIGARAEITEQAKRDQRRLAEETSRSIMDYEWETKQKQLESQRNQKMAEKEQQIALARFQAETEAEQRKQAAEINAKAKQVEADAQEQEAEAQKRIITAQLAVQKAEAERDTQQEVLEGQRKQQTQVLEAETKAKVETAQVVAEADAKAAAILTEAKADLQVKELFAKSLIVESKAKRDALIAEAEGLQRLIVAQNAATPIAILSNLLEKHGESLVDNLDKYLSALQVPANVFGANPTFIGGGQEKVLSSLLQASAAGLFKSFISEGNLDAVLARFASKVEDNGAPRSVTEASSLDTPVETSNSIDLE